MPTLSPLTAILPVLCALTGYYVGKTAGLRAAERTQLAEKDAVQKGSSTPAAKDRKGKGKVVAGGDEEWESEDESSGEIDIKKLENIREDCKMILVVRTDLGMTKGKIAAQCGHATLMCYKSSVKHAPHVVRSWETTGQAKIAVQVKGGEDELVMLKAQAMSLGVVAKIVYDAGRTGVVAGTATVLGIGPAPISVMNQISGHLKLL